jgi:4-diphosphocytidyl-2-C-methyl-D-erythritol kinase
VDKITIKAPAKINLGLDVLRKREDGYHEVHMIMQTVTLFDELSFEKKEEKGISLVTNHETIETDDRNLIVKAAKLFLEYFSIEQGLSIYLKKQIPVAAGMAGGSTDAAATLLALTQLLEVETDKETLCKLGVKIGADVPYFILQGTALSQGIGEILTPLKPAPDCFILLIKPPIEVSTKFVYENLKVQELKSHPDMEGIQRAIEAGDLKWMCNLLENVLESVTIPAHPIIKEIKELALQQGAITALMSGSGPTVFAIFEEEQQAKAAKKVFEEAKISKEIYLTRFFQP